MAVFHSTVISLILLSAPSAYAQSSIGPMGAGPMMHEDWGQTCLAQVALTQQQITAVRAIFIEFDPPREKAFTEMRSLLRTLRDLTIEKASAGKIAEVEAKLAITKAEQIKLFHSQWARIDAVLSPQQRVTCTAEYESKMAFGAGCGRGSMMGKERGW
jgi:Spy/CpxP family protein refolding chaperone